MSCIIEQVIFNTVWLSVGHLSNGYFFLFLNRPCAFANEWYLLTTASLLEHVQIRGRDDVVNLSTQYCYLNFFSAIIAICSCFLTCASNAECFFFSVVEEAWLTTVASSSFSSHYSLPKCVGFIIYRSAHCLLGLFARVGQDCSPNPANKMEFIKLKLYGVLIPS